LGNFRCDRKRRLGHLGRQGHLAHFRLKWAPRFPRPQRRILSLLSAAADSQGWSPRLWRGAGVSNSRGSSHSRGLLACVSVLAHHFCWWPLLSGTRQVASSHCVFSREQSTGVRCRDGCRGVSESRLLQCISVFRIWCIARGSVHTPQLPWLKLPAMTIKAAPPAYPAASNGLHRKI
jgi:hypothetical protein